ncbi:MAG: hypothetical protein QXL67_04230 [Candidatus Bathyarchaeia archaeon]
MNRAHPEKIIVVAGKNSTLNVSSRDSPKRKTSEIIVAEMIPALKLNLLYACMVNRHVRKMSPKPKKILPSRGKRGIETTTGRFKAINFSPLTTMNLVTKTWKTSSKVKRTVNRIVVFHVNTIPESRESDRTEREAKRSSIKSFQKMK